MSIIIKKIKDMPLPVKASMVFVLCNFIQRGISVMTTPIFTRMMSTEQFGYYSVFNSWLDIVSVFTTLKLAGGVYTQSLVKFNDRQDSLTTSNAGLGTALSIIFALCYWQMRENVNTLMGINTLTMICIIISSWAGFIFELWSGRQRVDYKYKAMLVVTMVIAICKPLLALFFVYSTPVHKAEARILGVTLIEVGVFGLIFISIVLKDRSLFSRQNWKYSIKLNLPLIPHYLTRTVLNHCDRIMINSMIGLASAGIYSLAYNLAWMLSLLTTSILNSFNPWMYKKIKNQQMGEIGPVTYVLLIGVGAMSFIMIGLAPEMIMLFAPVEYYEAIWVIPPVTLSVYFLFMYNIFANIEFYFEKTKFMSVASMIGGGLNIILNFIFIKRLGYIAAGYTTLICYITYTVSHYWCMKRLLDEKLGGYKIYNMKVIAIITSILVFSSFIMLCCYKMAVIRYTILIVFMFILWCKRSNIVKGINYLKLEK